MKNNRVLLIGAGPASLAAGTLLIKSGYEVTILEREGRVGGISKTVEYKGYRFDVGGHRFFSKDEVVNALWRETLGKDFIKTPRLSRIYYNRKFFKYPIEIGDALKNAGVKDSFMFMSSFARYRLFPTKPEKSFTDWVSNRFGKKLFMMFFKAYTEKVWGISTDELSAEWAEQRIKGLSLGEAVKNALFKPKHKAKSLIDEFYYPKHGPGMMYEAMAEDIKKAGGKIILNLTVQSLVVQDNKVVKVVAVDADNRRQEFTADHIVSTMPLPDTARFLSPEISQISHLQRFLKFRDFISVNLIVDKKELFPDTWIYVHDPSVTMGRIQNFKNWSKYMTPNPNHTPVGCEYFCSQGDRLWNTSDDELIALASDEFKRMGLLGDGKVIDGCVYRMRDAYPVYMGPYQKAIRRIRKHLEPIKNLHVAGRGGMFRYNNMDHSIATGLCVARTIMGEQCDPWKINEEQEYHEVKKSDKLRS